MLLDCGFFEGRCLLRSSTQESGPSPARRKQPRARRKRRGATHPRVDTAAGAEHPCRKRIAAVHNLPHSNKYLQPGVRRNYSSSRDVELLRLLGGDARFLLFRVDSEHPARFQPKWKRREDRHLQSSTG